MLTSSWNAQQITKQNKIFLVLHVSLFAQSFNMGRKKLPKISLKHPSQWIIFATEITRTEKWSEQRIDIQTYKKELTYRCREVPSSRALLTIPRAVPCPPFHRNDEMKTIHNWLPPVARAPVLQIVSTPPFSRPAPAWSDLIIIIQPAPLVYNLLLLSKHHPPAWSGFAFTFIII